MKLCRKSTFGTKNGLDDVTPTDKAILLGSGIGNDSET
jgi:hypothetical protein